MKEKIYYFVLTLILILSLSISAQASTQKLPLITSGYTENGIYYEVHGETFSQRSSDSQYVIRYVTYSGNVTPLAQTSWEETINGKKYTGTLKLTGTLYNKMDNITTATYEGVLRAK